MGRLSERIIALLLILFLLSYVGYQAHRYYYNPLQTETVFEYSISHAVNTTGVAVRDEEILYYSGSGTESYVFEDGERVSVNQTVVEFYQSRGSDQNFRRLRELEQEIDMLTEAQNPAVSNYSNAESLGRDIREQLGTLTVMSNTSRYADPQSIKSTLTSLLSKRQVAIGREEDYAARIQILEAERDQLQAAYTGTSMEGVASPFSGYFVKDVDGLEDVLTTGGVMDGSLDDYRELVNRARRTRDVPGAVGKIVTSQNWYFVTLVPKYDVQWVKVGQSVHLRFDTVDETVVGTLVDVVEENQDSEVALIIRLNMVTGDLLSLRHDDVLISFQRYTGLRINTADLRFRINEDGEEERGVYVVSKNTVRFKTVDPIYEESSYIISKPSNSIQDDGSVKLFDQVITKGRDLYDGKVIE